MHALRLGNTQPVCVGLRHRRGRPDCERSPGDAERVDSPRVAQIFTRAHEYISVPVSRTANFCQVRVMKRSRPSASQLL